MDVYEALGKNVMDLIRRKYSYMCIKTKEFEFFKHDLVKHLRKVSNDNDALAVFKKSLSVFNDVHLYVINEKYMIPVTPANKNEIKQPKIQVSPTGEEEAKIAKIPEIPASEKETKLALLLEEAHYAADLNQEQVAAKKYEELAKVARELGQKERARRFHHRARHFRKFIRDHNHDNEIADTYLENKKVFGPITVGTMGDLTYVRFDSFRPLYRESFEKFNALELTHDKYIIDLRAGPGGDFGLVDKFVRFLLGRGQDHVASYVRQRKDENDPSLLTDFDAATIKSQIWVTLPPEEAQNLFDNPQFYHGDSKIQFDHDPKRVAVLMGPMTASSGENVLMELKAIPGSISIGDVSRGQSGYPAFYLLDGPNAGKVMPFTKKPSDYCAKFAIAIPSLLNYRSDKELLQGNGIVPDILLPSKTSIVQGKDRVLETAINWMRST